MKLPRFPHTAIVVFPALEDDGRGNEDLVYEIPPATSQSFNAWLQQNSSVESADDGRTVLIQTWAVMLVAPEATFIGNERVIVDGVEYSVFGHPEPCYTLRKYNHTEMRLKRINGN